MSVSNSASVSCNSRLLLLSIPYFLRFFRVLVMTDRACAIKRRHCASRLTFTRRTRCHLSVAATQQKHAVVMLRRTATASAANVFSRTLRLSDYVMRTRPQQKEAATPSKRWCSKKARTRDRTIMEMPAKQTPAASSEIVKLIRKLRWVGLEEKAQQLEKELEQHAVTDPVISIQSEAD